MAVERSGGLAHYWRSLQPRGTLLHLRCFLASLVVVSVSFAQTSLERANQAFVGGRLEEAERLYLSVLQTEPRNYEALYKYGLVLLKCKRPAEAADYLNRASVVRPTAPDPYIARANAYLDLGKTDTALAALRNGELACQHLAVYWIMRGSIEARLKKIDDSRYSLNRARKADPRNPLIAYQAGTTFLSLGDLQSAEECLRASFALAPEQPTYAAVLAKVLHDRKNYAEAAATAKKGLSYNTDDRMLLSIYTRTIAAFLPVDIALKEIDALAEIGVSPIRILTAKGSLFEYLAKHAEALAILNDAITTYSSDADARLLRASVRLALGDYAGVVEDTDVVLASPEHARLAQLYEIRHEAFAALRRPEQAERALRSWIAVVPADPRPYTLLAQALIDRQAHAEAAAICEALLAIAPDDEQGLGLASSAYLTIGRANRVIELIEAAFSRGSKTPNLYVNLALAHRQQGDVARALGTLKQMRAAFPQDFRGWTLAGATLESALQFESALSIYRDLLRAHPNDDTALVGIARTLVQLQRHAEAAEAYVALADAFPEAVSALLAASAQYRAAGTPEKAEEMWSVRLKNRETDIPLLGAYARYLIGEQKHAEAVGVYRRMISIKPDNPQPYRAGAEVLEVMGEKAEAFALLVSGVEIFYHDRPYLEHLKNAALASQKMTEYATTVDGLFEKGLFSHASVNAFVESRNERGLLSETIALLRDAAQRLPGSAPLWAALSRALSLAGESQESLASLERAADAEPTNQDLITAFAATAERLNDPVRAAKAFRMLADLLPTDPGPVLKAAAYLQELGQKEGALALLRHAESRMPGNPEISAMIRSLGG